MELHKQIKWIAEEVAAAGARKIYYGTVESEAPLSVRIDQRFVLPAAFLTLTEAVTELKDGETVLRPALAAGDRVVVLDMENSDYLILGRVI